MIHYKRLKDDKPVRDERITHTLQLESQSHSTCGVCTYMPFNIIHTYLSDSTARQGWIITYDNPIEDVYSVVWYYNALHALLFTKDMIHFYQCTYIFIIRMWYMHVCDRETRRHTHAPYHSQTARATDKTYLKGYITERQLAIGARNKNAIPHNYFLNSSLWFHFRIFT